MRRTRRVERFATTPSTVSAIVVEHFHGAAVRFPVDATAFGYRTEGFNLLFTTEWLDAGDDQANIDWTRSSFDAMTSAMVSDVYVNYLDDDEQAGWVASAYGANYAPLQRIKKQYDPDNVFHLNQNILPG